MRPIPSSNEPPVVELLVQVAVAALLVVLFLWLFLPDRRPRDFIADARYTLDNVVVDEPPQPIGIVLDIRYERVGTEWFEGVTRVQGPSAKYLDLGNVRRRTTDRDEFAVVCYTPGPDPCPVDDG